MSITPEDVMGFTEPTSNFLCPLSANVYGIDFLAFTIEDYDTKRVIFEVNKENIELPAGFDFSMLNEDAYRKIKYDFSVEVLQLPRVSTVLTFAVGPQPVEGFKMIERHYSLFLFKARFTSFVHIFIDESYIYFFNIQSLFRTF